MILPNQDKAFEYENNFYLSCDATRMGKALAQSSLLERVAGVDGDIVECGVFKGASFARLSMYRKLFKIEHKRMIGFDSFGRFPDANIEGDKVLRSRFVDDAGDQSITTENLTKVLSNKKCVDNVELIKGDIIDTVPDYVKRHPELQISFLNLDVDVYEPSVIILKYFYPLMSKGAVLLLDNYGTFPGETNAVDEYFQGQNVRIEKGLLPGAPPFIIKG